MKSILKSIGIGLLIGALAFFAFKLVITFFIIGAIMMLLRRKRFERHGFGPGRFGRHRFVSQTKSEIWMRKNTMLSNQISKTEAAIVATK